MNKLSESGAQVLTKTQQFDLDNIDFIGVCDSPGHSRVMTTGSDVTVDNSGINMV